MKKRKLGISRLGRKARKLKQIDERYISPSYTRVYPLFMDHGKGAYAWDSDGHCFLDFTSGVGVTATGHSHPRVVEAIEKQARRFLHMSGSDFYYEPEIVLAEKLASIAPGRGSKKVFFCNSGAEAIEAAIKLSRYSTKRQYLIAFYGSFHGRTLGALSLTSSKAVQRSGFSPLLPGVIHVAYGDCAHCAYGLEYPGCGVHCVDYIEDPIFKKYIAPEEVAAIFVEPIQGEGGYIVPPDEFHPKLRELATKHGILLVDDEVQSGMGRTGKMFAIEHWGVAPDIIAVAKGIASGLPLGAIMAPADLMNWGPGSHASTFGGNPVSCAAAIETIKLLEESLIENAARMGKYLIEKLHRLEEDFEVLARVNGKGLMIGMEIVEDKVNMTPAPQIRDRILEVCFKKGLLILPCGNHSVRFIPPLIIGKKEADLALCIFEDALKAVTRRI